MSGRPRTRLAAERGVQPGHVPAEDVPPRLRATRAERRHEQFQAEYGREKTPLGRLACAFDYFRGAASRRCPDPTRAETLVEGFTTDLIAAAEELLAAQAEERRTP